MRADKVTHKQRKQDRKSPDTSARANRHARIASPKDATDKAARRRKNAAIAASAALALILILLACAPDKYAPACLEGLQLWLNFVVPTLFPFFVFTAMLTKLGFAAKASSRLSPFMRTSFRMPGIASYCFVMSALSGYPVGSRLLADLADQGLIEKRNAVFAAALCSTSGPMFLIGSVGASMFGSRTAGLVLLASHFCAVVLVSFLIARFCKKEKAGAPLPPLKKADGILAESVFGAVLSILTVGGFIALFFVLTKMLTDLKLLAPLALLFGKILSPLAENLGTGFATGLLEATHGCAALSAEGTAALPAAAFLVTFGGACILAQQLGYLKRAGVKPAPFIAIKFFQAIVAFFICLGLCAAAGLL